MSAGFLLNTNVPSETLRPVPHPEVTAWVATHSDVQFVSVVSIGEPRRGATLPVQGATRRLQLEHYLEIKIPLLFGNRVLPVTQAIAERWGILDAPREAAGQPLGIAHGMIAATAIEHDLTLVTRNVKDFAGLGVMISIHGNFRSPVAHMSERSSARQQAGSIQYGTLHRFAGEPVDSGVSLFTAIQEQLGLRLNSGKGPVKLVFLERAEKPSRN